MIDKSMRYAYRYGGHPGGGYAGSSSSSSSSSGGGGGGGGPPNRNFVSSPPPTQTRAPTVSDRVSPQQSMAMKGDISLAGKTQDEAQASVDRDNKLEQLNKMKTVAMSTPVFKLPTPKKPTIVKTSGTGPFNRERDDSGYQDKIRAERKIEFNPDLSNKEKSNLKYALGLVADQDFGEGIKRNLFNTLVAKPVAQKVGLGALFGPLGVLGSMAFSKFTGKKTPNVYDVTTDLFSNLNKGTRTGTINNRSNVQDTRDGIRSNIVAGGGDVVSQKVKEFTGEPTVEKPVEQKTDPRQLQALKLLKQLQEYDSQNRLNEKGKQALAQLISFTNQPITGRSRDI